jgi:hypothetical protein
MAGGNEAQRSDRFDLPKNMAFTFIKKLKIWIVWAIPCGHCDALRSRLPSRNNENSSPLLNSYKILIFFCNYSVVFFSA